MGGAAHAREVGAERLEAFLDAHPAWPTRDSIARRIEEQFYASHADPKLVEDFFAHSPPQTVFGKLALARALASEGKTPMSATSSAPSGERRT